VAAALLLSCGVAAALAAPPGCGPLALEQVAAPLGLDFRHQHGGTGAKHLPESMGAGAAWLDYDGDGWWDLYLVQSGPFPPAGERAGAAADRLFRNVAGRRFEDVTAAALPAARGYGQGVTAADVDGDGATDLYLASYGPDRLLRNGGGGRFHDDTERAGLGLDGWSSSAAFADADRDGDLDLYVTRYVLYDAAAAPSCRNPDGSARFCDPSLFLGAGDRFYRNSGDGRFADATVEAGLEGADGRGLGVLFTDLDADGLPDLYVANDLTINLLFRNLGGRFEDVSLASGAAVNADGKPEAGMGLAVGDVDGDLDPDLAVTNFDVETNTLYANEGDLLFTDVAAASGLGPPSFNRLGFGLVFADLDRDGALDAFVANGHVFDRPNRDNVSYRQAHQVLLGDGRGRFRELPCATLEERPQVGRGAAAADFDNDGDVDLLVQDNGGAPALLRNGVAPGRWLGVQLRGAGANREAVGAVAVLASGASPPQSRWVTAGDSYQSTSDRRLLFGVPQGEAPRELAVRWPSGQARRLRQPPLGRYLVVPEPGPAAP
jgi:hypothetical protein